jgi:ATPase subunit of ABC transporter with duplicated ATPase domains
MFQMRGRLLAWCFDDFFSNINKQYGKQLIFVDASFQLNPGEKVGLVGPNGAGKTTLVPHGRGRGIPRRGRGLGSEEADHRLLSVRTWRRCKGRSVLDEAIAGSGRVGDLHHELEALHRAMEDPARADDMDRVLARFGEVQEEYEHLGGYTLEAQAREVLHGLGFRTTRSMATWARCRAAGRCAWRWRACCWAGRTCC